MGIMGKKTWRYIARNLGQFLAAAAVVMGGIIVYIAMSSSYYTLGQARDNFYRDSNFADYYFQVVKAPESVVKQVEVLSGVKRVTGRVQQDLPIIKDNDERATARVVGYHLPMNTNTNSIALVQGRLFSAAQDSGSAEVVLDPKYLAANNLTWGDQITAVVDGKEVFFTVVGSAISPEFVYAMKDSADILPDPQKFGIFMLENRQAQQMLNMPGQINQVLIEFTPGADQAQIIAQIKDILRPYGMLASYPRHDQLSNAVLQSELDGLRSVTTVLPLIFLGIAASIQFVILRRMIRAQRSQIGLMKGLGYHNYQIMLHYTSYALAVSLVGAIFGIVLGVYSSFQIAAIYATYFNLPGGVQGYNLQAILYGLVMCLISGSIAGLTASSSVLGIQPAASMRPEPPKLGGKSLVEHWPWLWRKLNSGWKMTLRNISRNRGRFLVTLLGVVFAVGLLVISFFTNDALDYMMGRVFYQGQTYDIAIRFNSLLPEKELLNISRMEGVQKVEAFLELPVRIHFQGRSEDEVLLAYAPDMTMKKLESGTGQPIQIPPEGMLINQRTAKKLGIKSGDQAEVETLLPVGPVHRQTVLIVGENRQLVGAGSYIDLQQANRILQERNLVSGAMLKVEPGMNGQVEAQINKMLGVGSVLSHAKEITNFEKNLETMGFSIAIMVLFAVMLGFAIVYNAAVMNMAEREREIGSMRVMGFSVKEISALMLKENMVQAFWGCLLGLPFGRYVAEAYVQSVSTDLYSLPVVIYPRTYLFAALGGIIFILMAHFFSVRGIKDLDLVAALKSPE
ncbi:MAG: FtsX-like permease family protein [Firmicutes bacterium]|nr:FtsX-like permease family protein [Bacillota bacterium]